MVEPTQNHHTIAVELHAHVTVLTIDGFMGKLRQARLSAAKTREDMSPKATEMAFSEPTNDTL